MGADILAIGKHQLNTSDIKTLAADISERFEANVQYGIEDWGRIDKKGLPKTLTNNLIVFGEIKYPNAATTLWLQDEYYVYHQLYKKHGSDIFNLSFFKSNNYSNDYINRLINNRCFELNDVENDTGYGVIYNDIFHDYYNYYPFRWYSFYSTFVGEENKALLLNLLQEYRMKVKSFFQKIGGFEVFYFDDQGKSQYLTEEYYSWSQILREVETHFKNTTVNIPNFIKNNASVLENKEVEAFYDDFIDLY